VPPCRCADRSRTRFPRAQRARGVDHGDHRCGGRVEREPARARHLDRAERLPGNGRSGGGSEGDEDRSAHRHSSGRTLTPGVRSRRARGGLLVAATRSADVRARSQLSIPLPAPAQHRHRHTTQPAPHPAARQRSPVRRRSSQTPDPPPDRPAHGTPERADWKLARVHAPARLGTRDPAATRFYLERTRPRCMPHGDGRPAVGNALDFAPQTPLSVWHAPRR
jgi:hypothetical protein